MSLRGTLSSQLDVIEQRMGGLLVRTQLGWFGIKPGSPGQILAYSDEGIPEWKDRGLVVGVDTGWVDATLLNGWVNFGGVWANAAYRRTAEGIIFIRGGVKGGTATTGTVMFQLPSIYRPDYRIDVLGYRPGDERRFDVLANGDVVFWEGSNNFMPLFASWPAPFVP